MRISVPKFKQESPYTCLPACVRMILAYLGDVRSERELSVAFQTTRDWGTLPEQVENVLTTWGYHVRWFENVTLERLEQLNQSSFPVLAFVRTVDLTRTSGGSLHALIIVDVDDHSVISLDPELDEELKFDLSEFLRIWSRLNYQGMVIWR